MAWRAIGSGMGVLLISVVGRLYLASVDAAAGRLVTPAGEQARVMASVRVST
jgi:hypothetical protein